jgi:pimeloyl-ACP methyl ester carboxylesterase
VTPLVLVHGFMGGAAQWAPQLPELTQDRRLFALDLPGFGAAAGEPPIHSIGGFADWVIAEMQGRGVDRFHLLGHSMGGMIVQEVVRRAPQIVDHFILYATGSIGVLPGRFETIEESKRRAAEDGPGPTARRIAATWFLDREDAPTYEACAQIAERSTLAAMTAGLDAMQGWSGAAHLPQISQKTLLIWGDGDRTYPWGQIETLWSAIPRAGLAVVPGCAHAVHLEKPSIFNALLRDFLPAG